MTTIKFTKREGEQGKLAVAAEGKVMEIAVKERLIVTLSTYVLNDRTLSIQKDLKLISQQFKRAFYLVVETDGAIEFWEVSKKHVEKIFVIDVGGSCKCRESMQ